jgi:hypothetical protein
LLDVDQQVTDNDEILKPIVQEDEGMKSISLKLKELMESKTQPEIKQVEQPESKSEKPKKKQPKPVEGTPSPTTEEAKLNPGAKIHVDPEYDIFGVDNPESSIFKEIKNQKEDHK